MPYLLDLEQLEQMDFGGGNACSAEEYTFLASLVLLHAPRTILEIGTSTGIGALSMAAAGTAFGRDCRVTTIDIPFGARTFASGLARNREISAAVRPDIDGAIEFLVGDSRDLLPKLATEGRTFELVFIDGDHGEDGVRADWRNVLALRPKVVVLHDSVHHASVARFVDELKGCYEQVTFAYPPGHVSGTSITDVGFVPDSNRSYKAAAECPGFTVFTNVSAARGQGQHEIVRSGHETADRLLRAGAINPAQIHELYREFGFSAELERPGLAAGGGTLEIVLTGRNDGFGGQDFNERMFAAAAFNHRALTEAGIPHEFTLVEWNPTPGRPLLADIIRERLPWWTRAYVVSPAWHEKLCENPRLVFMEFFAKNVAIRRSQADWILTSNTDIFYSRDVIECLARGPLVPGTLYRALRIDVDRRVGWREATWDLFENCRNHLRRNEVEPPYYVNGAGDFLLLDRESYHRVGGFNELVKFAKIYKDGQFCIQCHRHGLPIRMIGEIFHLDHDGSFVTAVQKYGDKHEAAPFGPWWDSSKPYVNRRDWGLTAAVEVSEGPSAVRLFTPEERGPNLSVICPVPSGAASIERLVATYEHSGAEILLSVEDGVPVPAFDASLVHIVRGRTRTVAINEALARAKGRRICLLATAAECAPRDVAQLMRRFDQDPELMALSCAGTPASNRPASVLLFRRETYERLGGLDELASMPLLEFWRRIQEAGGAEEANVGVRMLSSGGTADWMLDSSIEKEWSELAFGSPGTSDIPCLLLRDYRRRTLRLQGALIARLRVLLPPQTTAVRILGLDAVMTPLLVAAVRQLNLRITAIYTDDAQYAGEIWAGIPIRSAAAIARDDRAPAVLGSQTAADRYAAYSRLPYEQVVNPFAVDAPIGIEASFDFPLSALAEARSLRDDDRVEEAYSVYARMLGLEETDAELQSGVLFEAAHLAARSGRHRVAARLYRRLVRNGAEPRALMAQRLASAYREIGRPDLARRYYNRALRQQKAPPDIEAQIRASCHFHLGELDLQEDRRAQARRHFLRALAAQPSHGKAAAYLRELEAGSPSAEAA